jgi:hypothetical protein
MIIACHRDAVLATEAVSGRDKGVDEDETPRGKRYKRRGGIVQKIVMAVDLYYVVPNRVGWYAQMLQIREHFKREITKWNEGYLEYLPRELSIAKADESYYGNMIKSHQNSIAFAYEISDMDEHVKSFKYHGFYCVGAWRSKDFRPLSRPDVPYDWNLAELNEKVRALTRR